MSNSIGTVFRFTSFGESHGNAIGGVVDGCPSGIDIDETFVRTELNRRQPGVSPLSTQRCENDFVEFLSGIFEGKTTGTPIGFVIRNEQQRSQDYERLKNLYRPSHADYTCRQKYGVRDYRGGGRSSARETATRVVAGAIAKLVLKKIDVTIYACTSQVGPVKMKRPITDVDLSMIETNVVRCPDAETAQRMIDYINGTKDEGDSIGGTISCIIKNVPVGLGEPVFDKLQARLALACMSINAAHGFDYGAGFDGVGAKGSELNDAFYADENGRVRTKTNHSGGIQGGISNGEDVYFRVLFKPVATIAKKQTTVDVNNNVTTFNALGRHDPTVLPRAVPVVESMAAMTILDLCLMQNIRL
ncbi:MAG: chorismate synthase [Prevotellaceae bacterium]|jgi:chorismate synthase|nr:chorismate synthase [Prevotellaceae bacterium]